MATGTGLDCEKVRKAAVGVEEVSLISFMGIFGVDSSGRNMFAVRSAEDSSNWLNGTVTDVLCTAGSVVDDGDGSPGTMFTSPVCC